MPKPQQSMSIEPPLLNKAIAVIDDGLVELMEALESIDENKSSAELNEESMIDNMGRRIYY